MFSAGRNGHIFALSAPEMCARSRIENIVRQDANVIRRKRWDQRFGHTCDTDMWKFTGV